MKSIVTVLCTSGLMLLWSCLAQSHHSVGSSYDSAREIKLEIVVVSFRFINPHPYVTAKVLDNPDALLTLEMDNRWELVQLGFTDDTLKTGDKILVTANPSRNSPLDYYVHAFDHPRLGFRYVTNARKLARL